MIPLCVASNSNIERWCFGFSLLLLNIFSVFRLNEIYHSRLWTDAYCQFTYFFFLSLHCDRFKFVFIFIHSLLCLLFFIRFLRTSVWAKICLIDRCHVHFFVDWLHEKSFHLSHAFWSQCFLRCIFFCLYFKFFIRLHEIIDAMLMLTSFF